MVKAASPTALDSHAVGVWSVIRKMYCATTGGQHWLHVDSV